MTSREKILATIDLDRASPPPFYEFSYWAGTVRRWYKEGLVKTAAIPVDVPSRAR